MIFKELVSKDIKNILKLTQQLNSETSIKILNELQQEMFTFRNYKCFGIYKNDELIGLSSGWMTIRLYSGKQLEIDNVIIDKPFQSQGYGKILLDYIENWALKNACKTIELNTYVENSRSHKFYFNQGYKVLGFHFQKYIGTNIKNLNK